MQNAREIDIYWRRVPAEEAFQMALSLNLRGDLAKLSDAELAERLEASWRDYEAAERRLPLSWLPFTFRGPVRHPRAYRFVTVLQGSSGHLLFDLFAAAVFSNKRFGHWVRGNRTADMHLSMCEIKDLTAEIERRVERRKGKNT